MLSQSYWVSVLTHVLSEFLNVKWNSVLTLSDLESPVRITSGIIHGTSSLFFTDSKSRTESNPQVTGKNSFTFSSLDAKQKRLDSHLWKIYCIPYFYMFTLPREVVHPIKVSFSRSTIPGCYYAYIKMCVTYISLIHNNVSLSPL